MKKLLLIVVFAMSFIHNAAAMNVYESIQDLCYACIVVEKMRMQEKLSRKKSIIKAVYEKIERKILIHDAPDFLSEVQKKYDCRVKKYEKDAIKYLKNKCQQRQNKRHDVYQRDLGLLNASKNRVVNKFGQDIFLAPINDPDVQQMRQNFVALSHIIAWDRDAQQRDRRTAENKYEKYKQRIDSFYSQPERRERYFKSFRYEKLMNMNSTCIKKSIYKEKMNKE